MEKDFFPWNFIFAELIYEDKMQDYVKCAYQINKTDKTEWLLEKPHMDQ